MDDLALQLRADSLLHSLETAMKQYDDYEQWPEEWPVQFKEKLKEHLQIRIEAYGRELERLKEQYGVSPNGLDVKY